MCFEGLKYTLISQTSYLVINYCWIFIGVTSLRRKMLMLLIPTRINSGHNEDTPAPAESFAVCKGTLRQIPARTVFRKYHRIQRTKSHRHFYPQLLSCPLPAGTSLRCIAAGSRAFPGEDNSFSGDFIARTE